MLDLTRGVRSPAGYPIWMHRPAGTTIAKVERCEPCGRFLDQPEQRTTGCHTLWADPITITFQCCDSCAADLIGATT